MEPIFGRHGEVLAWQNQSVIHDRAGRAIAFLSGLNVVNYRGVHLGVLDRGLFRDHSGAVVAFARGGTGGPVLPVPSVPPVPPVPSVPPVPPVAPVPPVPAVSSLGWSRTEWQQFLGK